MDREPRKQYSTDLTDAQWGLLEPLLPAAKLLAGLERRRFGRW